MDRRFLALVVFALARLPAVLGLASCCVNSTSGVDFVDDCICLVDNTQLSGQVLAAGQTRIYHWVLGMDNSELVSGSVRGNLTFEVRTVLCTNTVVFSVDIGSKLFFMRATESPHPTSAPELTTLLYVGMLV